MPRNYPDFTEFGEPPCASSYPDAFFSDDAPDGNAVKRGTYSMEREAKATCFSCPYVARCLEFALGEPDLVGIWGGTTEYQRKAMRRGKTVPLGLPSRRKR